MRRLNFLILILLCVGHCVAQQVPAPASSPTPPISQQDTVKVFTEEVVLPVRVTDQRGRFDPTVDKDELLILEDGVPQQIMSARLVPANVLLLISTAGDLNPAMKANISKEVAAHFVSRLKTGDRIAVAQYGRQVQTIQNWTEDLSAAQHAIQTRLSSKSGANLADALEEAVNRFAETPAGNRHLVLITDGVDDSGEAKNASEIEKRLQPEIKALLAQAVTVHIVSYAGMGRKNMWKSQPLVQLTANKHKTAADVALEILKPIGSEWEKPKIRLYVDTDIQMRRRRMDYLKAMKEGERWLRLFAVETGGTIFVPLSVEAMLTNVEEIAGNVDSQYVITYKPKRSFASGTEGEYRRLEIAARRVGLVVSARRGYVVPSSASKQ
ncbi:MAG TPA: VWA domain-containing protein [Pyrinomonadaceae bacterium]|nr:VWA domain-containing protein [Pyrinomonadaceae bacterium]